MEAVLGGLERFVGLIEEVSELGRGSLLQQNPQQPSQRMEGLVERLGEGLEEMKALLQESAS